MEGPNTLLLSGYDDPKGQNELSHNGANLKSSISRKQCV